MIWSIEKVQNLDTERVKSLRANALRLGEDEVASLCDQVLVERKVIKSKPNRHIAELHYHCPSRLNLTQVADGRFRSGNWVIAEQHCDSVVKNGAILALHENRSSKSFFQGRIIDWETAPPEIKPSELEFHRAIFLVEPTSEPLDWFGEATGERGYKWSGD